MRTTPALTSPLLRTDLGLADGEMVRNADEALQALADNGDIAYTSVGDLPLGDGETRAATGDIGCPMSSRNPAASWSGDDQRRSKGMAEQSGREVRLSATVSRANIVLTAIADQQLKVGALIVLDDTGTSAH